MFRRKAFFYSNTGGLVKGYPMEEGFFCEMEELLGKGDKVAF